jgi:hypothetical protein
MDNTRNNLFPYFYGVVFTVFAVGSGIITEYRKVKI